MYARITDADCMCEPCMLKLPYLGLRMMLCLWFIGLHGHLSDWSNSTYQRHTGALRTGSTYFELKLLSSLLHYISARECAREL